MTLFRKSGKEKGAKNDVIGTSPQTTGTGGILTPFVIIFGWIIRAIYSGLATMGIYNVGLCIILFTLVSKLILLPINNETAEIYEDQSAYAARDQ